MNDAAAVRSNIVNRPIVDIIVLPMYTHPLSPLQSLRMVPQCCSVSACCDRTDPKTGKCDERGYGPRESGTVARQTGEAGSSTGKIYFRRFASLHVYKVQPGLKIVYLQARVRAEWREATDSRDKTEQNTLTHTAVRSKSRAALKEKRGKFGFRKTNPSLAG
jgi:hypothetical protein